MSNMSDIINNTPEGKKAVEKAVRQSIADQEAMSNAQPVDELRLLVSKLMLGTMGIKNKYNSPAVHPKPMNDELDVLFLETVTAITQLFTKQLDEAYKKGYTDGGVATHDQKLLEAILEGAKTLSEAHKSDKIVGFRPCEAVPVEHIKSVFNKEGE